MRKTGLIILAVSLSLAFSAYAQMPELPAAYAPQPLNLNFKPETTFLESVNSDKDIYENCPISKAGDGALNAATAWVDIPKGINKETQDSNLLLGLTLGFGKGVIAGFTREVAGVVDMTTFGLPPYDRPLMKPEYRVEQPDKDGLKIPLLSW